MKARKLIDLLWPDHNRNSCSDENPVNGFYSSGLDNKGTPSADGKCLRCMLLEVDQGQCEDGRPIPADGPEHIRRDW